MTVAHAAEPVEISTALHRARPEVKVLATFGFVLAVALVGRRESWPYAVDLVVVLGVALWARVEPGFVARRLVIEVPFVLFVVLLPFFTNGPRTEWLGVSLSRDGLWAAWSVLAKSTLAVIAAAVLAATTTAPELMIGMQRLRVPAPLVAIGGFAVRYVQVVMEALARVQVARTARGDDPRWLWQARAVGQSFGGLAIRCLARGERVHGAMLARGYDGTMPDTDLTLTRRGPGPTGRSGFAGSAAGGATGGSGGPTDDQAAADAVREAARVERRWPAWAGAAVIVGAATAATVGGAL